ncbi:MAG: formyltransferase family protein [Bacteroidota bacterium]
MKRFPLYKENGAQMLVAGLLSGEGSNMRKILEYQYEHTDCAYSVALLFSDNAKSNATAIGKDFNLPVFYRDIQSFYATQDLKKNDLSLRHLFDDETKIILDAFHISTIALAGYASVISSALIENFLCINIHPADLSKEEKGKRKYTGLHAVEDALREGEKELRSTTHIVNDTIDGGEILLISDSISVKREWSTKAHQKHLKEQGDWIIFPKTLSLIAEKKIHRDADGKLFYIEQHIPKGVYFNEL